MTRPAADSIVRLLTAAEAADRLGLSVRALDRLVRIRALPAVRVSAHGGRRFWPRDIDACRQRLASLGETPAGPAAAQWNDPTDAAAVEPPVPGRAAVPGSLPVRRKRGRVPNRPLWPPFTVARRTPPTYVAFADADHLERFVAARSAASDPVDAPAPEVGVRRGAPR